MSNCQGVMESADVPEVLMAVVDVVLYTIEDYPNAFASHFRVSSLEDTFIVYTVVPLSKGQLK